jgi:hypothetical protein
VLGEEVFPPSIVEALPNAGYGAVQGTQGRVLLALVFCAIAAGLVTLGFKLRRDEE